MASKKVFVMGELNGFGVKQKGFDKRWVNLVNFLNIGEILTFYCLLIKLLSINYFETFSFENATKLKWN